jgi:hypothetical protein
MLAAALTVSLLSVLSRARPTSDVRGSLGARDASSKLVVAHMMVGNTFPYTQSSWEKDIALAQASGIDGFALNLGTDGWQADRVSDAYVAYA